MNKVNAQNLCRQFAEKFDRIGIDRVVLDTTAAPSHGEQLKELLYVARDLCGSAKKFTLPSMDTLVEDFDWRGLSGLPFKLPYTQIAIELPYMEVQRGYDELSGVTGERSKCIVFAAGAVWDTVKVSHGPGFAVFTCLYKETADGFLLTVVTPLDVVMESQVEGKLAWVPHGSGDELREIREFSALTVAHLLNMLACSNVHVEQHAPRKPNKNAKNALPFDTYHTLTIDVPKKSGASDSRGGSHAAPREHLRRGHIRRLDDGRRIWVNSCVVSAGRGFGKVDKDYRLRPTEHRC